MTDRNSECERMRVAVSARLDGEPLGLSAAALDAHLASCRHCSAWAQDAARLTRTARVATADVPDLSAQILASVQVSGRRARRPVTILRLLLFVVGLVQFGVSVPDLFGDSMGMHMAEHAAHESAAWNAALGAAFVVAALRPRLAAGLLPMLAVFVGLLAVLSGYDLSQGAVDVSRLATHAAAALGLVILAAMVRLTAGRPGPQSIRSGVDTVTEATSPRLRGVA